MDIAYFRSRIKVSQHTLAEDLEIHADHMEKIGRKSAAAARAEAKAKQARDETEARLIKDLLEDNERMALNKAQATAKASREYQQAQSVYLDAQNELAEWQEVEKAWYQRGFDLRALVELFSAQYFQIDPTAGAGRAESRRSVSEYMSNRDKGEEKRNRQRRSLNDE